MAKKKKGGNKKKKNNQNNKQQEAKPVANGNAAAVDDAAADPVEEIPVEAAPDSDALTASEASPETAPEVGVTNGMPTEELTVEDGKITPTDDAPKEEPTTEVPEADKEEAVKEDATIPVEEAKEATEPPKEVEPEAVVESQQDKINESEVQDEAKATEVEPVLEKQETPASESPAPQEASAVIDDKETPASVDVDIHEAEALPAAPEAKTDGAAVEKVEEKQVDSQTQKQPVEDPQPQADEPLAKDAETAVPDSLDDSPSDEMGPAEPKESAENSATPTTEPQKDESPKEEPTTRDVVEEKKVEPTPSQDTSAASKGVSVASSGDSKTSKEVTFSPQEKPKKAAPKGLTFAAAFGTPDSNQKPAPIDTERSETKAENPTPKATPTPTGLTFAQAFGSNPPPPVSPLATPASVSGEGKNDLSMDPLPSTKSTNSSHSALSASKNKKVSDRMSKYMDEVHHEPLPGDSVPIKKKIAEPSPSASYSSQGTPLSAQSIRERLMVTEVELAQLPKIESVRDKFESSSRSSGSGAVFEFGESFRQKKRYEQLTDKERAMEAKVAMHGFNERDLFPGRTASGEIDTSNLGKVYTFEMSANASLDLPPDGTCKVEYKKADYSAMVFVVHRTRGMLLLHIDDLKGSMKSQVPSGKISEEEFLEAAKRSGSHNVQLQIAAREAAARQLYENTGLDIRSSVDRFKPAILRLNPPVDARGIQYLKNEHDNKLYYFLQVDDEDFALISSEDTTGQTGFKLKRPSEDEGDSGLTLRLRDSYEGFTFILDPADASNILKKDGNKAATALNLIMNEASEGISANGPDAKATEYSVGDSAPDDEKADRLATGSGNVRTVGEKPSGEQNPDANSPKSFHDEADLKVKSSNDTQEHQQTGVSCCCGWW